ncbi:rhamnogalacturonan acetylesterase [Paenibacillus doosanensis]|uniref:Rhamnogalacturonan acetylesterase RhgT n=1 Tax=Paenibacillus konkukensis TaxID=2020716 RepID=A0ABY4RXF6_9BACL|nr:MULTISPECIES: rhamnogalacturonan acetylesterase [Paenibacillus]MCS7464884.1 rhamnogalacturonan acetylesterase [Paenibacillus doosanensis]UQZ86982.1 Rhamnogalacturonan acetylesterase RhgT [Paenibacillus konkukensis]
MNVHYRFSLDQEHATDDAIKLAPFTPYSPLTGYGFARSVQPSKNEDLRDSWPGDYFPEAVPTLLIDVPYGNYRVSVALGRAGGESVTTVKAGLGSLMLDRIRTGLGEFVTKSFAAHVADGQLKLAFSGEASGVRSVEVERVQLPTMYLAGDSTVTDQPSGQYPYAGWGQMITALLNGNIAVSNHARSGRSSKSFITENRLNNIWNKIVPGDYLFVQFAHNDEKDNEGGTKPESTYPRYLREYIDGARRRGAYPVLVAPMHRRFFDSRGRIENTHGEYIGAMRRLAEAEQVPFLDLAAHSQALFEQMGEEATKRIFMWAEPGQYPNLPEGAQDNTHFCEAGGVEIARLVVRCIREAGMEPLVSYLR